MNSANRVQNRLKSTKKRRSSNEASNRRRILFEQLEDRRLLAADLGMPAGDGGYFYLPSRDGGYSPPEVLASSPRIYDGSTSSYLTLPRSGAPLTIAMNYLRQNASRYGLESSDINNAIVKSQYRSQNNGVTHIALRQTHNDIEVQMADILVNVMSDGRILDVFSTFVPGLIEGGSTDTSVGPVAAFSQFAQEFGFELTSEPAVVNFEGGANSKTILTRGGLAERNVAAELVYIPIVTNGQQDVELAWNLNVEILQQRHWYSASISAEGGGTLYFEDWVSNASYNALPIPNESPLDGTGREILVDPHDPALSPFGWHDANGLPGPEFFDTRGNNVDAREDRPGNFLTTGAPAPTIRPQGGANLNFDAPLDLTQQPIGYTEASVTNLFVWTNIAHDVFGKAGFTEEAGNFQSANYTRRGLGGDPVLALGQVADDGAMAGNNAFMATPPDGQQPTMAMFTIDVDISDFIVDSAMTGGIPPGYSPRRDFSFAPDVVVHEYSHGVTNRLTGGPANVGALADLQSSGMGEGWGDYFGLHILQQESDQKNDAYPQGTYLMGPNPLTDTGIRRFPYSFDMSINPLTFADFNGGGFAVPNDETHNAGEIWAQTLWDMEWLLIDKYGYDPDVYDGVGGNNLAFQLVMTGLKLQPVNPTFLDGRDAILRADFIENQGVNHKEIWEAFARRGMGFSANADITNSATPARSNQVQAAFDLPPSPAFINGTVWSDLNNNGLFDGEPGIENWQVFIDLDNDGRLDALEPATTTDANGQYSFQLYVTSTLNIAETLQSGRTQTFPLSGGSHTVSVNGGVTVNNVDFGISDDSLTATAVKFNDLDGDGRRDEDEPGMPGFWIYVDLDDDGRLDLGEPTSITKEDGTYDLTIDRNGTFNVREVNMPGWIQTFPGGAEQAHSVTVTNGSKRLDMNFGNIAAVDFGDAPDSYGTTIAADGASHGILPNLMLGLAVDAELNGLPTTNADGDDLNQTPDDEDGVRFENIFFPGSSSDISVTINTGTNAPARLNAWFDFNRNGVFTDSGEQMIVADRKESGAYTYTIQVPADAVPGLTYARFRYSYQGNIGPTGPARDGEVEDYLVRILNNTPEAVDDSFTTNQDTNANQLQVLTNDISSLNGPILVTNTSTPNRGGRVLISADGTFVTYTPAAGFFGNETFTYTIEDRAGVSDSALVTLNVLPSRVEPVAIDDSYEVQNNSSNNELRVLSNDLTGQFGNIELVDFTQGSLGFVGIERNGTADPSDDFLTYTPTPNAAGTDQFTYTIQDMRPAGQGGPIQRAATVTVHIQPGDMGDDDVQFRIQTVDLAGTPTNTVLVGEQFKLQVHIKDLRDPLVPDDLRGIAAGFLDVLYDFTAVSIAGPLEFGPLYLNVQSGNIITPGLIDEAGAFQSSITGPVGPNEQLLFEILMNANVRGDALFTGDPADIVPFSDTLTFEPPQKIEIPQQLFVNTPLNGSSPMLNHTLRIENPDGLPQAVDNTFLVDVNSTNVELDVLANDFDPGGQQLTIGAVGARTDGGTVLISNNGTRLSYTPRAGFNGTEQFTYTIRNADGVEASATVTAQVGTSAKDLDFRLETTDSNGSVLTEIAQGSTFQLRVHVRDLRAPMADLGVFAAYLDVLLDSGLVSTIPTNGPLGFDVTFGADYLNGPSGNSLTNVIDELGSFQTSLLPLGGTEKLLATMTLRANAVGVAQFVSDPADISPLHDPLLFEPTQPVDIDRMNFGTTSIVITGGTGEGEFVFQNPSIRHDVDNNGFVTPRDALLIINDMNSVRTVRNGEGEGHNVLYFDVNGDGFKSPNDVLQVINYINGHPNGEGEGGVPVMTDNSDNLAASVGSQPLYVGQAQFVTTHEAKRSARALVTTQATTQPIHHPVPSAQVAIEDVFAVWESERDDHVDSELLEDLAVGDDPLGFKID